MMLLGVSWTSQFVYAVTTFLFGFLGGIIARLYYVKGKINKIEQVIVDFFATTIIALLFLLSVEIGGKGQLTGYALASFLLGTSSFTFLWNKIAHSLRACWRRRKSFKE